MITWYTGYMNKKLWLAVASIILVIFSSIAYVALMPKNDSNQKPQKNPSSSSTNQGVPTPVSSVQPGSYVAYSPEAISTTPGTKLLFFHAPWCPQCREIEADIKNRGVPENVTVFKVDYDSSQELRRKYGVTIQTTFVKVNSEGEKQGSYVAYQEPTFRSVERELLP